jgi:hypothetical protein
MRAGRHFHTLAHTCPLVPTATPRPTPPPARPQHVARTHIYTRAYVWVDGWMDGWVGVRARMYKSVRGERVFFRLIPRCSLAVHPWRPARTSRSAARGATPPRSAFRFRSCAGNSRIEPSTGPGRDGAGDGGRGVWGEWEEKKKACTVVHLAKLQRQSHAHTSAPYLSFGL